MQRTLRRRRTDARARIGETLRFVLIAVFGAVGTLFRYSIQVFTQVQTGSAFPWGTLLINLTGCFLLGLVGQITLNRMMVSPDWRIAAARR